MRSERFARALLRLYPRDWRERYGVEFLALIAENGLTWRAAVDIIVAATIERARRLIGLARAEIVGTSPLPPWTPGTDREMVLSYLGFVSLTAGLIVACSLFGVATPQWNLWFWLLVSPGVFDSDARVTSATIGERIALSFAWFLVAAWIGAVGWIVGDGLRRLGVPEPSDGFFLIVLVVPMLVGLVRLLYRGIASALNKPRPDITSRELWAWSVLAFGFAVLVGTVDPFGRLIWTTGWVWAMWLRIMRTQRVRAARRNEIRALRGF